MSDQASFWHPYNTSGKGTPDFNKSAWNESWFTAKATSHPRAPWCTAWSGWAHSRPTPSPEEQVSFVHQTVWHQFRLQATGYLCHNQVMVLVLKMAYYLVSSHAQTWHLQIIPRSTASSDGKGGDWHREPPTHNGDPLGRGHFGLCRFALSISAGSFPPKFQTVPLFAYGHWYLYYRPPLFQLFLHLESSPSCWPLLSQVMKCILLADMCIISRLHTDHGNPWGIHSLYRSSVPTGPGFTRKPPSLIHLGISTDSVLLLPSKGKKKVAFTCSYSFSSCLLCRHTFGAVQVTWRELFNF